MRALSIVLTLALSGPCLAAETQPLDGIRTLARQFVASHMDGNADSIKIEVGRLDSRLRLAECGSDLVPSLQYGAARSGNTTVRVSCPGPKPWSLYVPVSVKQFGPVVVLARPVSPGDTLSPDDVRLDQRDLGSLVTGYFTDPKQVVGKQVKRSLGVGQPLSRLAVTSPKLVRRGDRVVLLARTDKFEVRMEGKILSDGAAGDRVQVRNLRSNRVVEGSLTTDGIVLVQM